MRTTPVSLANLSAEFEQWEEKVSRYDDSMATRGKPIIPEEIKVNALIGLCPDKLQEHLSLKSDRFKDEIDETQSCEKLREFIFTYLELKLVNSLGHSKALFFQCSFFCLQIAYLLLKSLVFSTTIAIVSTDFLNNSVQFISQSFSSILALHS